MKVSACPPKMGPPLLHIFIVIFFTELGQRDIRTKRPGSGPGIGQRGRGTPDQTPGDSPAVGRPQHKGLTSYEWLPESEEKKTAKAQTP